MGLPHLGLCKWFFFIPLGPAWMIYSRGKCDFSKVLARAVTPLFLTLPFPVTRSRQQFFWGSSALFPHPSPLLLLQLIKDWLAVMSLLVPCPGNRGWTWSNCHHGRSHHGVAFSSRTPQASPAIWNISGGLWTSARTALSSFILQPWDKMWESERNKEGFLGFGGQGSLIFPGKPQNRFGIF